MSNPSCILQVMNDFFNWLQDKSDSEEAIIPDESVFSFLIGTWTGKTPNKVKMTSQAGKTLNKVKMTAH